MPETLSSAPNGKGPASQGKATVEARKSKKSCTRKRTGSNGEKTTTHPKSAATTAHGASARRVPVPHCRSAGKENKIGDLSLTVNTREASIPGKSSHQQRRKSSAASVGTTATLTMHQHRKLQEKLDRLDRLMRLPLDLFQDLGTCNQLSGGCVSLLLFLAAISSPLVLLLCANSCSVLEPYSFHPASDIPKEMGAGFVWCLGRAMYLTKTPPSLPLCLLSGRFPHPPKCLLPAARLSSMHGSVEWKSTWRIICRSRILMVWYPCGRPTPLAGRHRASHGRDPGWGNTKMRPIGKVCYSFFW